MAAKPEQYYNLFQQSPNGREVLEDMMKAHHFYDSTFVAGDPYMSALMEGERNAVLRILTILKQYEEEKKHGR